MALVDTIPTHRPVLPTAVAGQPNGSLPAALLRDFDGRGRLAILPSYGMQALHIQAWSDNVEGFGPIDTETVGRYRTFEQQVALVHQRMSRTPRAGAVTRYVEGHFYGGQWFPAATWYLLPGMAQVASPRSSVHGLGCADDVAEERTGDHVADGMSDRQLRWMRDNAPSLGWGLESHAERWHHVWIAGNVIPPRAVTILRYCGVYIDVDGYRDLGTPTAPTLLGADMAALITADDGSFAGSWYATTGAATAGIADTDDAQRLHDLGVLDRPTPTPVPAAMIARLLEHEGA